MQDDLIQWLLDSAKGDEARTDNLTSRVLMVNFGAIHTTAVVYAFWRQSLKVDISSCFVQSCRAPRICPAAT